VAWDGYRTPAYVWSVSAIAATTLHAGIVWLAASTWQEHQERLSPPAIAVIPLPASEIPNRVDSLPPVTVPDSEATATAEPETISPVPLSETPTPRPTSTPQSSLNPSADRPSPAESLPPDPRPTQPPTQPGSPAIPPDTAPRPNPIPEPTSSPDGELPAPQPGLSTTWRLLQDPGGSDLPDELPTLPPTWDMLAFAPDTSSCSGSELVPTGPRQVTLQLTVEVDGTISNVRIRESSGSAAYDEFVRCVIETQLPPLSPAMTAGTPMPTDAVLLTVTGQFVGGTGE